MLCCLPCSAAQSTWILFKLFLRTHEAMQGHNTAVTMVATILILMSWLLLGDPRPLHAATPASPSSLAHSQQPNGKGLANGHQEAGTENEQSLQQAFEVFRKSYAPDAQVQSDKALLSAKYAEAKAAAAKVCQPCLY